MCKDYIGLHVIDIIIVARNCHNLLLAKNSFPHLKLIILATLRAYFCSFVLRILTINKIIIQYFWLW